MKHKVFYSSLALRDLDDIWEYITHELQNPRAAEQVATHIMGDIQQLEKFPKLGASLDSVSPVESNYRFLVVGNYIAFYRVEKRTSTLTVYSTVAVITQRFYLRMF